MKSTMAIGAATSTTTATVAFGRGLRLRLLLLLLLPLLLPLASSFPSSTSVASFLPPHPVRTAPVSGRWRWAGPPPPGGTGFAPLMPRYAAAPGTGMSAGRGGARGADHCGGHRRSLSTRLKPRGGPFRLPHGPMLSAMDPDDPASTVGDENDDYEDGDSTPQSRGIGKAGAADRRAVIDAILAEDDIRWREERRMRRAEQLESSTRRGEEDDAVIHKLARDAGVTFTTLEGGDDDVDVDGAAAASSGGGPVESGSGTASLKAARRVNGIKRDGWFDDMDRQDDELRERREASAAGAAQTGGDGDGDGDDDGGDGDDSLQIRAPRRQQRQQPPPQRSQPPPPPPSPPKQPHIFQQKDSKKGASVGSAGGWTLEVFPGDFVVHRKYGIGRFERTMVVDKVVKPGTREHDLQQSRRQKIIAAAKLKGFTSKQLKKLISTFGTERDNDLISRPRVTVLEVVYSDGVAHVPVDKAYRLSRYRAGDAAVKPKLSRLRGDTWRKAKERVAASTTELAQDVLALYAIRETLTRPPFDPRLEGGVSDFASSFPYEPTPDQRTCFEDVENDMVWRRRPMDRLVCGDVGFGKTEVALRALYRCVANGRQAVLLSPTGILAAQHFNTVSGRMGPDSPYNVSVAMLRGGMGQNTRVGREIRERIASGDVQLLVGTHALLSRGIPYNNLGLLVIDEEQRFGVKQKERLKMIAKGVDVLTLSATPIPRTLQMSLSGIRDTSTIRSPPPMRKPVKSVVEAYTESVVREAIERELARGGQCFYVVPRVAMIERVRETITDMFPSIKLAVAHGQMGTGVAVANVEEFVEGHYDVLLATTVIENGVDIPTVNTIVIENSQSFGMSTLYQLRGRVGRSDVQAYAYFLHREESLTEQAVQRLQAMAELQSLGSGFDVAARDMEIRGAGSLLGTEQSGVAARVGFDLYMRMLKRSIRNLRGLDVGAVPRTHVLLPGGEGALDEVGRPESFFTVPSSYIGDEGERVREEGAARLAESTSALVELTKKWREEHGPLPASLKAQMKKLHLHACTRLLGVDMVGLVESPSAVPLDDGNKPPSMDCILRSPGLRPRHWATVCSSLPNGVAPRNVHVVFPARFTESGLEQLEIRGGKKLDKETLKLAQRAGDPTEAQAILASFDDEREDEEWDALDEEEGLEDVSSAMNVVRMDDVDFEEYPRIVVDSIGDVKEGKRVDALLGALLPIVNVVSKKQEEDQERAMVAMDLREKREAIKNAKKAGKIAASRNDYFY